MILTGTSQSNMRPRWTCIKGEKARLPYFPYFLVLPCTPSYSPRTPLVLPSYSLVLPLYSPCTPLVLPCTLFVLPSYSPRTPLVLPRTSSYSLVLPCPSSYFLVLPRTPAYCLRISFVLREYGSLAFSPLTCIHIIRICHISWWISITSSWLLNILSIVEKNNHFLL